MEEHQERIISIKNEKDDKIVFDEISLQFVF